MAKALTTTWAASDRGAATQWRGRAYASIRARRWADAKHAIAAWLRAAPGDIDAQECEAEVVGFSGDREQAATAMAHLGFGQLDAGHVQRAWQLLERGRSWAQDIDELSVLAGELADAKRPTPCEMGGAALACPRRAVVDCIDRAEPVGGWAVNDAVAAPAAQLATGRP